MEVNQIEEAADQVRWKWKVNKRQTDSERCAGDRKSGSCVTRLKCVSGVINTGEIHARLLCVAVFDSGSFPPHGPASLCFGNMCLAAMTHTSLNKTEVN